MSEQKHWLDLAEIGSAAVSLGGSIAALAGQSVAYATIPLSLSVILNLWNRNRLLQEMLTSHNQGVATLQQEIHSHRETLQGSLNELSNKTSYQLGELERLAEDNREQLQTDLNLKEQNLREVLENLQQEHNQIAKIVAELQQIENLSQGISNNPNCADFYYRRGLSHQHLGDKHGAIADYNKAIELDATHASAHHQRGILSAELGNRRQAVDDLRRAAKLYFEQGDIDSYQQARDLSKEFYEIATPTTEQAYEKINLANFLS